MESAQETKRRRRGEIREDGMVFLGYRNHLSGVERWTTKENYQEIQAKERVRQREFVIRFPEVVKERQKRWKENNREKIKAAQKKWRENNREKVDEHRKNWKKSHPSYSTEYSKKRRSTDLVYKMKMLLRTRLGNAFQGRKSKKTAVLLGAQTPEVKQHIERLFLPGMTWQNMGKDGWHIDHIIPLACAKSLKHLEALCHYLNLQPLWAKDNLTKRETIPETIPDNIKHLLPENWNE